LPDRGYFAVSLLPRPDEFTEGIRGLLSHFRSLQ